MGVTTVGTVKISPRQSGASTYVVEAGRLDAPGLSVEFACPSLGDMLREERGTSQIGQPTDRPADGRTSDGLIEGLVEQHREVLDELAKW
jgi:hypothetical protein